MLADSLDRRPTLWVATLRGHVVMLLIAMKIAITLLGQEPVRFDPGIDADYRRLSAEPMFQVTIDLLESAAWMYADNSLTYQAIYRTDQPPTDYTPTQDHQLRARGRANLIIVTRRMREWRTAHIEEPLSLTT
jgi:hypothetical protein